MLVGEKTNTAVSRSVLGEFDYMSYYDSITAPDNWILYNTHEEMINALNVPEGVLKNLSTECLAEMVINYPLWGDFLLRESGTELHLAKFNAYTDQSAYWYSVSNCAAAA